MREGGGYTGCCKAYHYCFRCVAATVWTDLIEEVDIRTYRVRLTDVERGGIVLVDSEPPINSGCGTR
jgi:hypothetical protein